MSYMFDSKSLFSKGLKYYNNTDYKTARMFFNSASNSASYNERANVMIVKIDIKEGRYLEALERVRNNISSNSPEYYMLMALINELQYNYSRSLDLLTEADKYSLVYYKSKLKQAQVHLEYGYFSVFSKLISSFDDTKVYNKSVLLSSMYYIIDKDYIKALETLEKIDRKSVREKQALLIEKAKFLLRYFMNKANLNDLISGELVYFKNILFDDSNRLLISHLRDSYITDSTYSSLNFIPGINYEQLVEVAQDKISSMNPSFHNFESVYKMILPNPTGVVNGREVNGLGVKTIIGTDKIIGMFPFEYTENFDEDKESENENLHRILNLK